MKKYVVEMVGGGVKHIHADYVAIQYTNNCFGPSFPVMLLWYNKSGKWYKPDKFVYSLPWHGVLDYYVEAE